MRASRRLVCAAAWLACACVTPSVTPERPQKDVVVAVPVESPVDPPRELVVDLDRCRLYTAGYEGLKCLDVDGQELATLLEVKLDDGLFIDDATIVAWSRATAQLFFLAARSGELLDAGSLLPPDSAACGWATTAITAPLPRAGSSDRLCLEIANGLYEEVEDVRIVADIDVRARTIAFAGVWGHKQCAPTLPQGSQCPRPAPIAVTADEQHPYFVSQGALHRFRASGRATRVWGPFAKPPPGEVGLSQLDPIDVGFDSFEPVATTASGRYLILLGNHFKGDVGHLQALLLDRTTGELFPLPEEPSEGWPAALDGDAIATIGEARLDTLLVLASERPRILPERDRFALGERLFEPGVGAKRLPGRLLVAQ